MPGKERSYICNIKLLFNSSDNLTWHDGVIPSNKIWVKLETTKGVEPLSSASRSATSHIPTPEQTRGCNVPCVQLVNYYHACTCLRESERSLLGVTGGVKMLMNRAFIIVKVWDVFTAIPTHALHATHWNKVYTEFY